MSSTRPDPPLPPVNASRADPTAQDEPRDSHGDLVAGGIFVVLGGAFALPSLGYGLGTWLEIGPGMFPFILGLLLVALGLGVAGVGVRGGEVTAGLRRIPWRAVVLIAAALLFFAFTVAPLGFIPATAGTALLACLASPTTSIGKAAIATACITVACYVIFVLALQLRLSLFWF